MLTTDPTKLLEEIQDAIKYRDSRISELDEKVRRFAGPAYSSEEGGVGDYAPENTYYEYISLMVPRLVYDNPRVQVSSRRPGVQRDVAEAMRHGLNRWVRDCKLRKTLVELVTDMLMGYGVCLVREEENKGVMLPEQKFIDEATPKWPVIERMSPRRFFVDPQAQSMRDARFVGHVWHRDKEDLIKAARENPDDGWDLEVINGLSTGEDPSGSGAFNDRVSSDREEIWCYELWVPEAQLDDSPGADDGFHGTLYTLGVNQSKAYGGNADTKVGHIRAPRPFYGPRTGPYVMFGAYKVPDNIYPLSPLVAVEAQVLDLNAHVLAASEAMLKHKRIIGANDSRTANLIKNTGHDFVAVVPFEDGKALIQEFELGGQTEQQALWINTCRQRVDRVLGMDEALRGAVSGAGTATEHTIASEAANTRMAFIRQAFTDATIQVLEKVAFYMYHNDEIVFPLGEEEIKQLGLPPETAVVFQGGGHGDNDSYTFEDLELEIEPYSMERASEGLAQKRALEMHQILLGALPVMAQFPDYPWKDHFAKIGNAMNAPDMSELVTPELLERFSEDLRRMQQSQAVVPPMATQPRFASDVGPNLMMPPSAERPTRSVPKMGEMVGQMLQDAMQPNGSGVAPTPKAPQ